MDSGRENYFIVVVAGWGGGRDVGARFEQTRRLFRRKGCRCFRWIDDGFVVIDVKVLDSFQRVVSHLVDSTVETLLLLE